MNKIFKSTKFQLLIIVLITFLAYVNILGNEFVIDDKTFIINWEKIRNLQGTKEFFRGATPAGHEGVYRPIRSIFYAIDYNFFSVNPIFYHLQAIFIHLASTVLVYFILRFFVRLWRTQNDIEWIAFFGALLFGLHPIHTETISYISASMETFGSLFFFASFYLYLIRKYKLSVALALLAFFTYEMTLTLPILIILYEFCFKNLNLIKNFKLKIKNYGIISVYTIGALFYFSIRFFVLNITTRGPYLADSFYLTILTMTKVFVKYISLLLLPINQANNHIISKGIEAFVYRDYRTEAILNQSIFNLDIIFPLLILMGIIGVAIICYKKYPFVSFGIGWFFISLLPASEIVPQGSMLNEKLLYIPSFGFVFLLSFIFYGFVNKIFLLRNSPRFNRGSNSLAAKILFTRPKLVNYMALVIFIFLTGFYLSLTFNRNRDWENEITLWSKDIKIYPEDNAYAYFALGNTYTEKKELKLALENYQKAISINPKFAVGFASIARTYSSMNKDDLAIEWYKKAIAKNPSVWEASYNLNKLYLKKNNDMEKGSFKFSFSYPKGWSKTEADGITIIKDNKTNFTITFSINKRDKDITVDIYLSSQKTSYGTLVNQGLAKVPNFDFAYVKIWQAGQVQKMQFFLFKKDMVLEVIVYPSDSSLMLEFDKIVESIKLN